MSRFGTPPAPSNFPIDIALRGIAGDFLQNPFLGVSVLCFLEELPKYTIHIHTLGLGACPTDTMDIRPPQGQGPFIGITPIHQQVIGPHLPLRQVGASRSQIAEMAFVEVHGLSDPIGRTTPAIQEILNLPPRPQGGPRGRPNRLRPARRVLDMMQPRSAGHIHKPLHPTFRAAADLTDPQELISLFAHFHHRCPGMSGAV